MKPIHKRTGVPPFPVKSKTPDAERTADLFNLWIARARDILADQPKANALTIRGYATDPGLSQLPGGLWFTGSLRGGLSHVSGSGAVGGYGGHTV